jgi:tRNA pseudouridine65 synthase
MEQSPSGKPEIIFEDHALLVANKPNRMLVHRTKLDFYESTNLLNLLAHAAGYPMHPAHRLDKPTSGVILFAKSKEVLSMLREQFNARSIRKRYVAIVRGFTPLTGSIDRSLSSETDATLREARTEYRTLMHTEQAFSVSRYPTSRYSFIEAFPETGRYHQLRMHFDKIRHPIVGDSRHGDRKHNHYFREKLKLEYLFLHAASIELTHPDGHRMLVSAPLPNHFEEILNRWSWSPGASHEAVETGNHRK